MAETREAIERMIALDREARPGYYGVAETIARIVDPAAFDARWVVTPEDAAERMRLRLEMQKAEAMRKAHDIMVALGCTETDCNWEELFARLATPTTREWRVVVFDSKGHLCGIHPAKNEEHAKRLEWQIQSDEYDVFIESRTVGEWGRVG